MYDLAKPYRYVLSSNAVHYRTLAINAAIAGLMLLAVLSCTGCGSDSSNEPPALTAIPADTNPCSDAYRPLSQKYWPYSVASDRFPFLVHYRSADELATARQIIAQLDLAWDRQINTWGYEPPPPDTGMCGPDGRFDVFIWRGHRTCHVSTLADLYGHDEFVTSWGGQISFMILDPWGPYGGEMLQQTVAHEFNHTTHAANDWHDLPISYEMSATYVEQMFGQDLSDYVADFQKYPDWGLLRNDDYQTWYMYGSALYLHFLRDYYFAGEDFDLILPKIWVAMRNTPDLYENSPNFVDALNTFLQRKGVTFMDSVVDFARWRYYAGNRVAGDTMHFKRFPTVPWTPAALLDGARLTIPAITLTSQTYAVSPAPMMTGTAYLTINRANAAQASFRLQLVPATDNSIRWVAQAVPGMSAGSDGDLLDLSAGAVRIPFAADGSRTLVLTALPATAAGFYPNHQTAIRYPVSIKIDP